MGDTLSKQKHLTLRGGNQALSPWDFWRPCVLEQGPPHGQAQGLEEQTLCSKCSPMTGGQPLSHF